MAKALRNLAAAEYVQRVARGFLARHELRKLIRKRALFLRGLQADQTGMPLRLIVKFQRRVRKWLSNLDLALGFYEDHRLFLHAQRTQTEMDALIQFLNEREAQQRAASVKATAELQELDEAPRGFFQAHLRLSRAQGEIDGLTQAASAPPEVGKSADVVTKARKEMATMSSEIERLTKQVDQVDQERRAHHQQAHACTGAALLATEAVNLHPVAVPLLDSGRAHKLFDHHRPRLPERGWAH